MKTGTKYRKNPVVIDAVQLRWSTWNDVCAFVGDAVSPLSPGRTITASEASDTCGEPGPEYLAIDVTTVHGETAVVRHGDWIIPDGKPGTFYPCKPDIFATTYAPEAEALDDPARAAIAEFLTAWTAHATDSPAVYRAVTKLRDVCEVPRV